jgi:hypothetical protein
MLLGDTEPSFVFKIKKKQHTQRTLDNNLDLDDFANFPPNGS